MLDAKTILAIKLAAPGRSKSSLSKEFKVSRATIIKILQGKRDHILARTQEFGPFGEGLVHRCRGCGALVRGECLYCYFMDNEQ